MKKRHWRTFRGQIDRNIASPERKRPKYERFLIIEAVIPQQTCRYRAATHVWRSQEAIKDVTNALEDVQRPLQRRKTQIELGIRGKLVKFKAKHEHFFIIEAYYGGPTLVQETQEALEVAPEVVQEPLETRGVHETQVVLEKTR